MSIKIPAFMTASIILALISFGCMGTGTGSKVQFTDAPIEKIDLSQVQGRKIIGRATSLHLFGIFPLDVNDRQMRAYERLKEDASGDYMTDIKIQDVWKFVVIGIKYNTIMTATAYPPVKNKAPVPTAQTMTERLDELSELRDNGKLTDDEYNVARKKIIGH